VGKLKIFWISPYYAQLGSGKEGDDVLVQYLRDKGWDVTIQDGLGNYQTVISDIESDIAQKADAIIAAGLPFNLAGTAYDDAYAAHIPVFIMNGQVTDKQVGAEGYDAVNDEIKGLAQ
jgi:ABC-type sugar transport system substrate-binding protein